VTLLAATAGLFVRRYGVAGRARAGDPGIPPARTTARTAVRAAVPVLLGAALLAGAVWVTMDSTRIRPADRATALSVVPAGAGTILVDLTSAERASTTFLLRVRHTDGTADQVDVTIKPGSTWSRRIQVPAGRVDVELYRPRDTAPYRTVYVAGTT
jgi:hypothetical protein